MFLFSLTLFLFISTLVLILALWTSFSNNGLVFTPQVFSPASHLLLFHNKSPIPIDKPFQKSTFPSVLHQKSPSHFSNLIAEIPFNVSPSSIVQGFFWNWVTSNFFVRMLGVPWPIRFCLVNCLSDFAVNLNPSLGFIYLERWQIE